jgi:2',3'-cyclic-nucleotide 2'-phosphodiesterase (5'-nucleotidase family)
MPNTNSSFSPITRITQLHALLEKLEVLSHRQANDQELAQFDDETEEFLGRHFGPTDARLEAYKYATLGEAETLVNLLESAQEQSAQDLPKNSTATPDS